MKKKRPLKDKVQQAMRAAVKKLLIERKKNGVSVSIWKDGKVVTIPAHKIDLKTLR